MSASASIANGGRAAALARRRALSAGKSALPPATQRVRDAERAAPASETPTAVAAGSPDQVTCREHALARRAEQNRRGRGTQPPAAPVRPPRIGAPGDAPKIAAVQLQEGPKVTASRTGGEAAVTGAGRGGTLPVSGTQYIGADAGAGWRVAGPKVGRARTAGGAVVSGTLVRSAVPVTGDEGAGVPITGNADQLAGDDLTVRAESGAPPAAHSGGTLPGSRERSRRPALEPREGGVPVTGSAAGRTVRVTGDASGAWRPVTGDQYLAPVHAGAVPPDPAGGAKIGIEETWGQRRVTGIDTGRHALVSGDGLGAARGRHRYPVSGSSHGERHEQRPHGRRGRPPAAAASSCAGRRRERCAGDYGLVRERLRKGHREPRVRVCVAEGCRGRQRTCPPADYRRRQKHRHPRHRPSLGREKQRHRHRRRSRERSQSEPARRTSARVMRSRSLQGVG